MKLTAVTHPLFRRLAGVKILYLTVVPLAVVIAGSFSVTTFNAAKVRWPETGGPVFASHFATWDAAHYLLLSENGYTANLPSCAFYPLWPLLVRWAAPLTAGSHVIAGLLLSNLCSLAAWLLFYREVARRWGERGASWGVTFLIAFPGSLFFQFLYSESLFLLLIMLLWKGLDTRCWHVAWVAAFLLPLTRAIGVFALLPIGWWLLSVAPPATLLAWRHRWDWMRTITPLPAMPTSPSAMQGQSMGRGSRWMPAPWLMLTAPLLGWSAYLALMTHWTGHPFEGFHAQRHWAVHAISNLWNVPKFVAGYFTPTEWHAFHGSLLDRTAFALLLYTLPALWHMDKGLLVWLYMLGILPAMSGTFTSYIRFASCAFPVFIALGVVLSRPEWTWLRWGLLALFLTLHVLLLWQFVNFRWAG